MPRVTRVATGAAILRIDVEINAAIVTGCRGGFAVQLTYASDAGLVASTARVAVAAVQGVG